MNREKRPEIPIPDVSPRKLTAEEYFTFTPEKIELVDGNFAPEYAMPEFLAALLTNVGLEQAIALAPLETWEKALHSAKAKQIFPDEA